MAEAQVAAVRESPAGRAALMSRTYDGPFGYAPRHLPFRRAAGSFMAWQRRRGVLEPLGAHGSAGGSPWWRACNERLLRDSCEAVARAGGLDGSPCSPTVAPWMEFVEEPSPATWYRAHNASIVAAYLDAVDLARAEPRTERFFLNVVLTRVLYAHAVAAHPRFALGPLAPLGRVLGDPRLGAVGVFLSLRRVVPSSYPPAWPLEDYLDKEGLLGRVLDHGVLRPRLDALYRWAAGELSLPGLRDLIADGVPSYAWSEPADHVVWSAPPLRSPAVRIARRVLRVEDATPGR